MFDRKLGYIESKPRSPGEISEKPCAHFRGHNLNAIFLVLCQNVYLS